MQLTVRDGYIQPDGLWQMNFSLAGILWLLGSIMGGVWIVLTVRCVISNIRKFIIHSRLYGANILEEDEAVIEEFLRIKKKLKIRGKIRLYRNDMLSQPMIHGIFFCSVILPYQEYSREQLTVIFHHELIHYKSHDSFFKMCGICIDAMQHLNLFFPNLTEHINEWSEFHCDMWAIDAISDEVDAGRYFEVIVDSAGEVPDRRDADYIFSMLCESQLRLERRIEYMKKYKSVKRATKGAAAAFAFVFVMASVTTTYAAGTKMAGMHDDIYRYAEVTVGEDAETEELEEFYLPAAEDDTYEELIYANPELEVISPLLDANEVVSFSWTVNPDTRHVTNAFYVSAGQKITISCSSAPASSTYWIGIQDGWNNVRYVEGTGSLAHTFTIESSGNYRVLVQNRSSVDITSGGSYYFY